MKVKSGFITREVAGTHIVIAVGARAGEFNGVVKLNETGRFLWKLLESETDVDALTAALTNEYDVSEEIARKDVEAFLATLQQNGVVQ